MWQQRLHNRLNIVSGDFNLRLLPALMLLVSLVLLTACAEEPEEATARLQGQIFGSFWLATLPGDWSANQLKSLNAGIQAKLDKVDASMSTYKADSELNRFNAAPVGEWVTISAHLYEVFRLSQEIALASNGAFDITVGGLVNLWSFGPEQRPETLPEPDLLQERLQQVGYQYLELNPETYAARRLRASYIDLSGVAKGYAVDAVASWLRQQGLTNFLVNIGGEIYVAGERQVKQPWRIGIETPDASQQTARHIFPLTDASLATSGDYRNYYEVDGRRFSHTLNPKTGWPIEHNLASVTVVHASNAVADAWATAFMVMGLTASLEQAELNNLQVMLLNKEAEGLKTYLSTPMQQALGAELSSSILACCN